MDDDDDKPSRDDNLARCYDALDNMSTEARIAVLEVINWMTSERPKDAEPASQLMMGTWVAEVMERNIKRRDMHRSPLQSFHSGRRSKGKLRYAEFACPIRTGCCSSLHCRVSAFA